MILLYALGVLVAGQLLARSLWLEISAPEPSLSAVAYALLVVFGAVLWPLTLLLYGVGLLAIWSEQ